MEEFKENEVHGVMKEEKKIEAYGKSYWQIVWSQFRKQKIAIVCLIIVIALYLMAIFAPFLSNNKPFYIKGYPGEKLWNGDKTVLYAATLNFQKWIVFSEKDKKEIVEKVEKEMKEEIRRKIREDLKEGDIGIILEKVKTSLTTEDDREIRDTLYKLKENLEKAFSLSLENKLKEKLNNEEKEFVKELAERVRVSVLEKQEGELNAIGLRVSLMYPHLQGESALFLQKHLERCEEIFKQSKKIEDPAVRAEWGKELKEAAKKFSKDYNFKQVKLYSAELYPLLLSLSWADILFMAGSIWLLLIAPINFLINRFLLGNNQDRIRKVRKIKFFAILAFTVIPSLIWAYYVPSKFTGINYRREIEKKGFISEKAVFPPLPYIYDETFPELEHHPVAPYAAHPLGTDDKGRDLLSRIIWGGRVSLAVGFVSTFILVCIGVFFGSLAGYFRGKVDMLISRFIEVIICFPSFFLILAVTAFVGPSIFNIMLVIGLIHWTGVARLTRGEFLRLAEKDFVTAARALGFSNSRIIFRHVLPNGMGPALVSASFSIASAILTESSLSFLGFGITEPIASWGGILSSCRVLYGCWWIVFFPGFEIFLTITCYNMIGEALRDAIDPRLKRE